MEKGIYSRWGSDTEAYMKREVSSDHPLRSFFSDALHRSLYEELGMRGVEDVEQYLADMLVAFLHEDSIFAIQDASGRRVESIVEMVAEGDVLAKADSFARERQVHKHVGDFLLFWSGVFPEFLRHLKSPNSKDALIDVREQGRFSYHVVSTFQHDPYADEAPTFKKLSEDF